MASSGGPMVKGSDGFDFTHREKVANHYKTSVVNKSRFKFTSILHIMLVVLMLFRLSVSIFVLCGSRPPSFLQKLRFPKAQPWEYVWLASVVASIFGLLSLKRNKTMLMQQFLIGIFVFGIGPVLYAMYYLWDDTMKYIDTREATTLFMGKPAIIFWNMFLLIALQVHFFSAMFAFNLLKAWTSASQKKRS